MSARRLSTDDALPTNDTYFAFDGTNSDLARQLYLRAKAGDSAPKLDNLVLPDALDERLNSLKLQWDELPGIAQRALLWDSGFVLTINNKVVQVWPLDGYSMSELAVPLPQFNAVNCTEMNCTHPEFDSIKSFSNLYCNGDEMRQAARCVVEDFDDVGAFHLAMWMTGGNPKVVPIPLVRKHSWVDNGSNISYEVAAVHTVESEQEATYGECPTAEKNGGYGSLVLPCYLQSDISEKEGIKNARIKVQGSPWVSRWLKDYSSSKSAGDTFNSGGFKVALVAPIAGVLLVIGLLALVVLVKRKRRNIEADALENSLIDLDTRYSQDKPHDSDFTLDTSMAPTLDDTLSVPHRGVDKTIKFLPSSSSASDFDSGSNSTLQILLRSDFLVGKRIPSDSLEFKRSLSKGACGEVWLAEFQGQRVAVKRLLQAKTHRADEVEEFAQEIELSASLIHRNIVTFVGVAWNSLNNLVMVLEFFPTGDLQTFLAKKEDLLSWSRDKIRIALGVGRALEYLHSRSPPLIHRDLKSKNILLTDRLEAKLIDFGVSRIRQEHSMTAGVGTPYWTAPEILEGKRYTEQADLYSFGVVLSELDTGKLPYHDALTSEGKKLKPFQILADVMAGMMRPSFSEGCPSKIRRIGVACCQHDQSRRPTAAQVVAMLQD